MKAIRKILASIRKADQDFNLISRGDKIIVGVSGGKDSLVLLYAMSKYAQFTKCEFELKPVILDLGFDGFDPEPLKEFCKSLGYELYVEDSRTVYPILKANQKDAKHLPCSICSRMKKAAINAVANRLGYNKVMFAHHADDAIETLIMNEIYGARMATFSPKMHLEKANIEFSRPLVYAREEDIARCAREENLPVLDSHCPADKTTTREDVKNYLKGLYDLYPEAKENFLTMLTNYDAKDLWMDLIDYKIEGTDLTLKPVNDKITTINMMNIRYEVFVKEQGFSFEDEMDGSDKDTTSYLICLKNNPIGVIRTKQVKAREFLFSRFCILKEYRGLGYGSEVMSYLEHKLAKEYNPLKIVLHAQIKALDFYKKLGYQEYGEIFDDAGQPHIEVNKLIKY